MARPKGSKNKRSAQVLEQPKTVEKPKAKVEEKFGTDFYAEIGRIGGTTRGSRDEERQIRNKMWEENKLPESYKNLINEAHNKTQLFRLMARDYVPRLFFTLKENNFDDATAKAVVFWDAAQIWTERRVYQVFSESPVLKSLLDARKQEAGKLGGEETAKIAEETRKNEAVPSTGVPSTIPNLQEAPRPEGAYSGKEEITKESAISSVKLNIVKHETALMEALFAAHNMQAQYIELDFNTAGIVTSIRPVPPESVEALKPASTP